MIGIGPVCAFCTCGSSRKGSSLVVLMRALLRMFQMRGHSCTILRMSKRANDVNACDADKGGYDDIHE